MPAFFEGYGAEGAAQIAALHTLRLGVIGSVGEAAALGAFLDESIFVPATKQVPDYAGQPQQKLRDFDLLALEPLAPGWFSTVPDVCGPHPLDTSIHAKMVGGIRAEIEDYIGRRDTISEQIMGWPRSAVRLVERQTASGHKIFTPVLGVMRAIHMGFRQLDVQEGFTARHRVEATALFYERFDRAAIPPEELLEPEATRAIVVRIAG